MEELFQNPLVRIVAGLVIVLVIGKYLWQLLFPKKAEGLFLRVRCSRCGWKGQVGKYNRKCSKCGSSELKEVAGRAHPGAPPVSR